MDLKIYDRSLVGAEAAGSTQAQETQRTAGNSSSGAQSSSRSAVSDQVELSGTLGRLSQALSDQGTARSTRVAALTASYQSGTYQPNTMGTAKKLVSEALSGGQSS